MEHVTSWNVANWLKELAGPGFCNTHKPSTGIQKTNKNLNLELIEPVKVSCKRSPVPVTLHPGTEITFFRSPSTNTTGQTIAVAFPLCRTFQIKFMTGDTILYTDLTKERSTPRRSASMRMSDE